MTRPTQGDFTDIARIKLATGTGPRERIAAWSAVVAHAEQELSRVAIDTSPIDCGPGCGSCCVVNVNVLEPEGRVIAAYLEETLADPERYALLERLERLYQETRWLDDEERIMTRKPCAFLDVRQHCLIHPARPLLCRSITSTDARRCHDAVAMLALGETPQIVCQLAQKDIYEKAYLGLAAALAERGLDASSHRLAGVFQTRST